MCHNTLSWMTHNISAFYFTLHCHIAGIQYKHFLMHLYSHLSHWRQCTEYLGYTPWTLQYKCKVTLKKLHHGAFHFAFPNTRFWSQTVQVLRFSSSHTAISQLVQATLGLCYFVLLLLWSCTSQSLNPSLTQHQWVWVIMQCVSTSPITGKLLGKHCHREGRIVSFGSQFGLMQKTVLQNKRISLVLKNNKKPLQNPKMFERWCCTVTQQLQFCVNNSSWQMMAFSWSYFSNNFILNKEELWRGPLGFSRWMVHRYFYFN